MLYEDLFWKKKHEMKNHNSLRTKYLIKPCKNFSLGEWKDDV